MNRTVLIGGVILSVGTCALAAPKPAAKPTGRRAAKAPAAETPAAVVARLLKDAATLKSGRYSLLAIRRNGAMPEGASGAALREAAGQLPVSGQLRQYLVHRGKDWKGDLTFTDPHGDVQAHLLLGVTGGTGRILQESGHGDSAKRAGTIGAELAMEPAQLLLAGGAEELLRGVQWSTVKRNGAQLILAGARGPAKVSAVIRTAPRYALEQFVSVASLATPQGELTQSQDLRVTYAVEKGALVPKTAEDLTAISRPRSEVVLTRYTVEGAMVNTPVEARDLEVAFPAGTRITDFRVTPPVRYAFADKEPTVAELKALGEQQGARQAALGKPAPALELNTLDGKSEKLADYKGKVVILSWFASWCGPCKIEAPLMEKNIWLKYRAQGLQVFGVNAGEQDDPHKMARQFVEAHGTTYPVLMDIEDEWMQAFQVQAFPTLAIIDRKGVLRYIQAGFNETAVVKLVETLLAEK